MLSRISTKPRYGKLDSKKKKILFVLALIFVSVVFYGLYNLSKVTPENEEKITINLSTGDQPVKKELKVTVNAEGQPLNLRKDPGEAGEKIGQIPDQTVLTVQEELNGWYKVNYDSHEGWISKQFTIIIDETKKPEVEATKNWQKFTGSGYAFKYPDSWQSQNYTVGDSPIWIGFSNTQLPKEPGIFLPIELKVFSKANKPSGGFRTDPAAKKETLTVSGIPATKYTFVSAETSTEINVVEFEKGENTYNFYDNGGYLQDLLNILNTLEFTIS